MRLEAWEYFKQIALSPPSNGGFATTVSQEQRQKILCGLIIDSPWLPGFMGISHLDYFTIPEQWLRANLYVEDRFPEVIFLPGFWVEYGMAIEPSAFGCKIVWWQNNPPSINPVLHDISELSRLQIPNPREDGLMPLALNLYRHAEKSLKRHRQHIKMVAARGPLAIAAHLRGITELMMDLKLSPAETKKLLEITTQTVIQWLQAQRDNLSEVEGIMVLDDIIGFLSPTDYLEFAHPCLKEIFSSFEGMVKVYHNDSNISHLLINLTETGFHVLNFSHDLDIAEVSQKVGGKIWLMGNIPPLDVLVRGTPNEVKSYALQCLNKTTGGHGLILSAGGGVSPGTPAENIDALVEALRTP
jgi:uroporphyrinogen-III decarboxylase